MASTKLILKNPYKDGKCLIYLIYQDKGKKFKVSTQIKVLKEQWDGKRIKGKSIEVLEANSKLSNLEDRIRNIETEILKEGRRLELELVKKLFFESFDEKNKSTSTDFFRIYDEFIQTSRVTKCEGTIKHYYSTRGILKEFENYLGKPLSYSIINLQLYEKLIYFLLSVKGYLNNTAGKHVKVLKAYLNYVKRNELTKESINVTGFKVFKEDVDIIALTKEELFEIYNCKGLSQSLEYVRDLFCFECFTGIRFSDLNRIKNENIVGDFLEFRTKKTRDTLSVPLNQYSKAILEKYNGIFEGRPLPPPISNGKMNAYLKDLGRIAKIDTLTMVEKFSGSKRFAASKPKYAFISTHTGRKTFITVSNEMGMPIEYILKITGIKKWDTLKKYLKVSEKSKLLKMNEFWNDEKMIS